MKPFRNHHIDRLEIIQHNFLETNGNKVIGANLIIFPALFLSYPTNLLNFIFYVFILVLSEELFFTNQIHK
ncbi:fatty acid desaturase CarF family protein [Candidatus Coxiella mudrowiae]|uniref:fatty acid desaturase CarF family protein n=1 Tax=Candidatus Coxiella mudrowiae TaxID=2054173 RepID=UPI000C282A5C